MGAHLFVYGLLSADLFFIFMKSISHPTAYSVSLSWIESLLHGRQKTGPLIVGVSGMQGIGKSTLCAQLVEHFLDCGRNVVSISIDDFYLSRAEQQTL